jgi:hypothetical protein
MLRWIDQCNSVLLIVKAFIQADKHPQTHGGDIFKTAHLKAYARRDAVEYRSSHRLLSCVKAPGEHVRGIVDFLDRKHLERYHLVQSLTTIAQSFPQTKKAFSSRRPFFLASQKSIPPMPPGIPPPGISVFLS